MRLTFRAKLMAVVVTAAGALLVLVVTSWLLSQRVQHELVSIRQQYLPKVGLAPKLEGAFERLRRGLQDAVAAADAQALTATRALKDALLDDLAEDRDALDPADSAAVQRAIEEYYAAAQDISRRLIAGETGEKIVNEIQAMQDKQTRASEALAKATTFDRAKLTAAFDGAVAAQQTGQRLRLLISLACGIAVVALALWISRGLIRNLAHLTAGFRRFGEGDFSVSIPAYSRDELGNVALQANQMAEKLRRLSAERDRVDWLRGGSAGLAEEIRGELSPGQIAGKSLAFLARYLEVPVAVLYFADHEGVFRLLGSYALAPGDGAPAAAFRPGQGLVGQVALQTEIQVVAAPPEQLRVRSGLVDGTTRALVFLPLAHLGKVVGVVELGVCKPWADPSSELLLLVRDTITIAIEVARGRAATVQTNEELTQQASELDSQRRALEEKNQALVDARRRLEQKAEELTSASAYKSQFLANMSHELRTPLNAIIGFAELMHDGAVSPDSPQHREFLGDILNSGRHLLQLINDVLDLSKVEAGKLEFRPERIQPAQLIGEVLAILRTTAAGKRIQVAAQVDPGLGELFLDPARLKQVLYNYISNALKFTPESGRVVIRALPEGGDRFRLEVEDTGVGIDAKNAERLFVEFQQGDGEHARRQGGTGLGLALTKRLVEAQGGTVGLRSSPGRGSVFFAVLPRKSQGAHATASARTSSPRPGAPSVLVVEDEPRDQQLLAETLDHAGYDLEVVATGAQALVRCADRAFDAITLDLLLPDMSGIDVLRRIRDEGKNRGAPIIVITVIGEPGAVAGLAVHDILQKPLDPGALLASLSRALVAQGPGKSPPLLAIAPPPRAH